MRNRDAGDLFLDAQQPDGRHAVETVDLDRRRSRRDVLDCANGLPLSARTGAAALHCRLDFVAGGAGDRAYAVWREEVGGDRRSEFASVGINEVDYNSGIS